jgi:hypothetical protein
MLGPQVAREVIVHAGPRLSPASPTLTTFGGASDSTSSTEPGYAVSAARGGWGGLARRFIGGMRPSEGE